MPAACAAGRSAGSNCYGFLLQCPRGFFQYLPAQGFGDYFSVIGLSQHSHITCLYQQHQQNIPVFSFFKHFEILLVLIHKLG
jgi:hypothetical protein